MKTLLYLVVCGWFLALGPTAFAAEAVVGKAHEDGRFYLVPEMQSGTTALTDGPRTFKRKLGISPAVGRLGNDPLFAMRVAFNPNEWLGYEISFGHNPASSLHAVLHTFNIQLRYPLPGRFQPYGSVGYGMITVYPGQAIQADPVTKNTLAFGGGLEIYLRDDVAVRGEMRGAVILGQYRGQDDTVAYTYREYTLGLVFYRSLGG
jgi:opacity protein-like surface antigen